MHITALQLSLGATAFTSFLTLLNARPLEDSSLSEILPGDEDADTDAKNLHYRQDTDDEAVATVYVTIEATVTDVVTDYVTDSYSPTSIWLEEAVTTAVPIGNDGSRASGAPVTTSSSSHGHTERIRTKTRGVGLSQTGGSSSKASTVAPVSSSAPVVSIHSTPTAASTSTSSSAPAVSTHSTPTAASPTSPCTTGDALTNLGFHITNAGSTISTYYIYASIEALSTSETTPYKCLTIPASTTIFVSIPPGLNGRIMRGLPYTSTPTHPSRGPASWFEFNHQIPTNQLWGDISLIQGYDGAILLTGSDGTYGFSESLPMDVASRSYSAALTTKTGYPEGMQAPTVIGPTVSLDAAADAAAYAFYTGGACGVIANGTYVSNDPRFNPNFQSSEGEVRVFNVTFFEGLV